MLCASQDKCFLIAFTPQIKTIDSWLYKKKQGAEVIFLSPADDKVIEIFKENCSVREIKGQLVTRTETSDKKFDYCCWIDKEHFVTSAGSEVCVWSLKQDNPVSILDTGSSQKVTFLSSKLSSKGRFSIAAASASTCFFFKLNFSKEKKTVLSSS